MTRQTSADLTAIAEADAASGHPAIRLSGVGKDYGAGDTAVHALRDTHLEVWPGEFVVVLGPSGSGKTTLLNLIGGIEESTTGLVEVAGLDVGAMPARARTAYRRDKVGFVFQFFNLVPTLTALENVEVIAELTGGDAQRRSREALERVGLAEVTDRFPGQMSGGQQQRVAGGRGNAKGPPERRVGRPTPSLDLDTGRQVLGVLRDLAREGHHTVLLVSHNSAIAAMADRVLRMHSGTISQEHQNDHPVEAGELNW